MKRRLLKHPVDDTLLCRLARTASLLHDEPDADRGRVRACDVCRRLRCFA